MIIEVKIPSVGESVTSGVVSAWHKKSGEFVNEGEPLFALETDKVSTDIVAEKSGVLETKVPEGQEVKIGEVVAVIDDSKQQLEQNKADKPQQKKKEAKPEENAPPVAAGADRGEPASTTPATALSPAVRRIVEEEKLEPQKIHGTGDGGRLTKADVLAAVEERRKLEPSSGPAGKAEEKIEATCDGAAHCGDSHHIQRMRYERRPGATQNQARRVREKARNETRANVVLRESVRGSAQNRAGCEWSH